jgi:ubiquinone/menaquinone biosynthesis C-methylase UbiE
MQEVLDKHYRRLAKDYDEFLYYSPRFVRALTSKMVEKLCLEEQDILADVGCGTGMYSLDILEQVSLKEPILGVDPYPEMLARIPDQAKITPIAEGALEFSKREANYNKILIKETIHHVDQREVFFQNIFQNLPKGGVMLLVHVPPGVKYPLFNAALKACLGWHADPDELVVQLEQAGFNVQRDVLDYQHRIPKDHYFKMVRSCYMSVLTRFSEEDLEAGLAEMDATHAGKDVLEFVDHFDYLTAEKPAS